MDGGRQAEELDRLPAGEQKQIQQDFRRLHHATGTHITYPSFKIGLG